MTDCSMTDAWSAEVVVLGAGAAGLCAALAAADAGASVLLVECSDTIGGSMAQSAGVVWVPNNHVARDLGHPDSKDQALTYLAALSNDRIDPHMAETYVDTSSEMLLWLEQTTALRFAVLPYPDYHSEHPGAMGTAGRSVEAGLFAFQRLGEWAQRVIISPAQERRVFLTPSETQFGGGTTPPASVLQERRARDDRAWGQALVGGLLDALLQRGIEPITSVRARSLELGDGRVTGVLAEYRDEPITLRADRGVIIATGGFDWNPELTRAFLRGPLATSVAAPDNRGDGLIMAQLVGAALGAMPEAYWVPMLKRPGQVLRDGRAFPRSVTVVFERSKPGSIIVNRAGRRFCNEAANYNAVMGGFHALEPNSLSFANLPAYLVFDHEFKLRVPIADLAPGLDIPEWMWTAPSLAELAEELGIDPHGLQETVDRFNKDVADGSDPDFHRGETSYERSNGDPSKPGPLANLGPLLHPPFYAVQLEPGAFGTRGGPLTNEVGQVRSAAGGLIPGLYAAGNAMASVFGLSYPGGGATLGAAFTFGYLAGRDAAGLNEEEIGRADGVTTE